MNNKFALSSAFLLTLVLLSSASSVFATDNGLSNPTEYQKWINYKEINCHVGDYVSLGRGFIISCNQLEGDKDFLYIDPSKPQLMWYPPSIEYQAIKPGKAIITVKNGVDGWSPYDMGYTEYTVTVIE